MQGKGRQSREEKENKFFVEKNRGAGVPNPTKATDGTGGTEEGRREERQPPQTACMNRVAMCNYPRTESCL